MKSYRFISASICALVTGLLVMAPISVAIAQTTIRSTKAVGHPSGLATQRGHLYYYSNYPTDKTTLVAQQVVVGGTTLITGSGTVALAGYMSAPTWATATLAQDSAVTGDDVTTTISGTTLTIKVWKPTATNDVTATASTVGKMVSWSAGGAS